MKRDWELIRNIFIKIEESDAGVDITDKDFPDSDVHTFSYHAAMLLSEACFVQGAVQNLLRGAKHVILKELTWDGHAFLDSILCFSGRHQKPHETNDGFL